MSATSGNTFTSTPTTATEVTEKEERQQDANEDQTNNANESPFQRDEFFFNMGNENNNDDWFSSKKDEDRFNQGETDLLDDINSFEFVEESRNYNRKSSTEEELLKEKEYYKYYT